MGDLVGYFLTWATYGTWLPGDSRGWVEHRRGLQLPDPVRELESAARMSETDCRLSGQQRSAVENQTAATCRYRDWQLSAANCRTNHVHVVVTAPQTLPTKIRGDLKAWATRRLKQQFDLQRDNWWAERGSVRWLWTEDNLNAAIFYVVEGQDRRSS